MASDIMDYSAEGEHSLKDISFSLKTGEVSKALPHSRDLVYLNLTTKEDVKFCVSLTSNGFQVRGLIVK